MAKLLIIEDSKMLCKIYAELLSKYTDFDFDIVETYADALAHVNKTRYEFAVADMNLPDAKRGEIISLLNKYNIAPIVFTGNFDEEFREGFESSRIVDYVLKERYENIMYVIEKLMQLQKNKNITVLIVDDSNLYSKYLRENLHIHHFKVVSASNGVEALEKLKLHPEIELIITDYHMPVMDGLDLVRKVRQKHNRNELPILVLTADTNSYETSRFLKEGANDYITKPFSRDAFYARIYQNIETRSIFESITKDFNENIIALISEIVEFKSTETSSHVKRISKYSYLLAKLNGIYEGEADAISKMSVLHDVGKVVTPDCVLCKKGKLDDDEFEIMKKHTTQGYEILKKAFAKDLVAGQIAMDIALSHHEKWDGSGYPNALVENQIPLSARIVAVVDVFDALMTKRVYKEAWDIEETVKYMQDNSGKHFDPKLIKLFIKNIDKFVEILKNNLY